MKMKWYEWIGFAWICLGLYCWYFEKGWWAVK